MAAVQWTTTSRPPPTPPAFSSSSSTVSVPGFRQQSHLHFSCFRLRPKLLRVSALDRGGSDGNKRQSSSSSVNYVVAMDKSSCITRPLGEILRDLNKRIPDNIIIKTPPSQHHDILIPWYHANRMLSFYAPGWCGEIRDVIFSENGSVTVVYRVTIRGSDGEAYRESTGTVLSSNADVVDPVSAAEEIAFCKACARFGLGLYLYHNE